MDIIKHINYQYCRIAKIDNVGYRFSMNQDKDIDKALQRNLMRLIDEQYGGNQAAFCRDLGFNPTYINAVVRGKKHLGKPNWEKIRKALDLRPDEFLHGADSPIVHGEGEQKVVDWYREMAATGMLAEAEMMMEYLTSKANKKKGEISGEGTKGRVPRRNNRKRRATG